MPRLRTHADGHCGLLRMVLHSLLRKYEVTERRVPSGEDAMSWYYSADFMRDDLFSRVYNRVFVEQAPDVVRAVLRKVIRGAPVAIPGDSPTADLVPSGAMDLGSASPEDAETGAVRFLLRNTIIIEVPTAVGSDKGLVSFASLFHRWHYASVLFPRSNEHGDYDSVDALVVDVLKTFTPEHISDRGNWGRSMVKEGSLQHMFFAGALACLPASTRVMAEVSNCVADDQTETSRGIRNTGFHFVRVS